MRQEETKDASRTRLGIEFQMTAMYLSAPFRDGQTQADAAGIARTRLVNAVEAVKHSFAVRRRDARAGVLHLDRSHVRAGTSHADRNPPSWWRILDRIIEKINNHLPQDGMIGVDPQRGIPLDGYGLAFFLGKHVQKSRSLPCQFNRR